MHNILAPNCKSARAFAWTMNIIVGSELTCVKDSNICKSSLQPEWNKGKLVVFRGYLGRHIEFCDFKSYKRKLQVNNSSHGLGAHCVTDALISLHTIFFTPLYIGELWIGNFGVKKLPKVIPFTCDRIEAHLVHEFRHTATTKSYLVMISVVSTCYYVSVRLEEHSSEISSGDHRMIEFQVTHFFPASLNWIRTAL